MKEILEEKGGFFLDFEMFHEMKRALYATFASGAVVIMASMAKACGRTFCTKVKGDAKGLEEALSRFSELMSERNWGEFSFANVDFKSGAGKFTVENSFETREQKADKLGCYFLASFTAGFLSELFAIDVNVVEKKCVGRGDENCEFEFYP